MLSAHRQLDYAVRFDWGLSGAEAILENADVAVVVDVLSFTTAVSVAVDAGICVLPYRCDDERARDYARERDAALAMGRSRAGRGGHQPVAPESAGRRAAGARRPSLAQRLDGRPLLGCSAAGVRSGMSAQRLRGGIVDPRQSQNARDGGRGGCRGTVERR
jgi:hypothetical protein